MSRKWLLFLFCLSLLVALASASHANLALKVDESTSRILFEEQGTRVLLAVASPFTRKLDGIVKVELIDTQGRVRWTAEQQSQITPGQNSISIPVRITLLPKDDAHELLWYRLRYQLSPNGLSQFDQVTGVVSLSQITPDIFRLQMAGSATASEGSSYRLRVRAAHPLTSNGVAGVTVTAEIKFDGSERDDVSLKQTARTDSNGFATLDFQIPRALEDDDGDISIEGRRGILVEQAESEIDLSREAQVMVTTDKPMYQPGQTLHMRVLMFDASRRALANQNATLKISDPESTTVFRADLSTSKFGVASADWPISENTRLGDYRVAVEVDGDKYEGSYGAATVKISRYDLPNFAVNVKPDRPYYLADQDAAVEVRADYLFGQPVKRGHVRVVRETERTWNYREQKWDTDEGDKYEGDTDADGKFLAQIKLGEEYAQLKDQDYNRYRDLTYAAYFTDPTTNRTEQRRFDLRLTKDAIHIYVVGHDSRQGRGLPLQFYVSTSYADGSPAACDIAISQTTDENNREVERLLQTVRSNAYGVARVSSLTLANVPADDDRASLMFRARDSKGATGIHAETLYNADRPALRIETGKSLYRDGESITAEITSSNTDGVVALDVIDDQKVLQSQLLTLHKGRATLTIPYRQEFRGVVTLGAYLPAPTSEAEMTSASRTVLYPHDKDLKFSMALDQESYRPGEDARASFVTRTATGRVAESALGIVIFDRAVEERARTDREFGSHYGFYDSYCRLTGCGTAISGITRKDLDRVDLSKPLPNGLDLVAEVLLTNYEFRPRLFQSEEFDRDAAKVFATFFKEQIDPLKERLDTEYNTNCSYPADIAGLRRLAKLSAIDVNALRDPWQTAYRTSFLTEGTSDVLQIVSAGGDKQFDTLDDVTVLRIARPYFRFTGEALDRAVDRYHARTGGFIRDAATLKTELRREGVDFDALRDPWGQPYQLAFGVNQTKFQIWVRSFGANRVIGPVKDDDDVALWTSSIDYTRDVQAKIDLALMDYFKSRNEIPQSEADFQLALKNGNIDPDELKDPWGRPYYVTFKTDAIYGSRITIYSYARYGEKLKEKTELTPVTQHVNYIYLRSDGQDGVPGTPDDFNVGTFSRITAEQSSNERNARPVKSSVLLPGSTGAITGILTDFNGAAVYGATVTAQDSRTSAQFQTTTGDDGSYLIKNLPAGTYVVTFDAVGFTRTVVTDVTVRSSNVTQLNASLNVGTVSATVTVTASEPQQTINASTAQISTFTVDGLRQLELLSPGVVKATTSGSQQLSTPRLREYFPETLVWQPALETDKQGRAQLKFKLADNITTWKMSVIGSTEDGQIGTIEKDIKAFQPFFVEHDPPRILTEGDEISLRVVVRNYLDRAQPISLEIKPENWFSLIGPALKQDTVPAGDAGSETFDFRADASVKDGRQRLTAIGAEASDAIEKPVTVHPDGEEKSVTASDIVSDNAMLTLDIPANAIPNSTRAELKIYPNLLAHVVESVEAIMQRPYGCGEQTISSTYPSLLLLRHYRQLGPQAASDSALRLKAERYLRAGYNRLLNYRDESGGFTYWGHGDPDLALTAYALRFLNDADGLIPVDEAVINQARQWLLNQQRTDGSWSAYDWDKKENSPRSAMLTAYIARVLAMLERPKSGTATANQSAAKPLAPALKRALDYLGTRSGEIDEPYLIAAYALAAIDAGDSARAGKAIARLRALAHNDKPTSYWSLESNTPFYGWGQAGRVETTALVVQALARQSGQADELVKRGLLFLLREKDAYGVWYSTQATINVLDAMLVLLQSDANAGTPAAVQVIVNSRSLKPVPMPTANRLTSPITIDLSQFLQSGTNHVELRRAAGSSPASAQAVANYYVPWRESISTQGANGLRLITRFDRTESRISDEITCHVEAERIAVSSYGMMLAEIGLPPGADVDRASLEKAMKESDWSISQYDILPDRVVVYLWPRAGGTKFDFKFRPRFGLNAQTAASSVYDYYNPEARATVPPARFVVR